MILGNRLVLAYLLPMMMLSGCSALSALIPIKPGIAVEANVGKDVTKTEQAVIGDQEANKITTGDDATVVTGDGFAAETVGKSLVATTKKKSMTHDANSTVSAEKVEEVRSSQESQEVTVGDNAKVTIVHNEGAPWWQVIAAISIFLTGAWGWSKYEDK